MLRKNLLLIEDNIVNVEFFEALLINLSSEADQTHLLEFKVQHAFTLEEAEAKIRSERFDLILLDLNLPDSRGIDTFKEVHKLNTRIPIIVLTGVDDTNVAIDTVKLGAQDYLVKGKITRALLYRSISYAFQRMAVLEALKDSEERYALALRATNDGLWEWNLFEHKIYLSPRWKEILGYVDSEIGEDPSEWFDRIHPEDVDNFEKVLSDHLSGITSSIVHEHRLLSKNGTYKWIRVHGLAVFDDYGSVKKVGGSITDVTSEKLVDSLTGLPNAVLFADRLQISINRLKSDNDDQFVLLFLAIEQLKLVNNSYGVKTAEEVLLRTVNNIKSILRSSDSMGRLEGNELGIILDGKVEIWELNKVIDMIQEAVSKPIDVQNNKISLSVSVGVVYANIQYDSAEEMLTNASNALQRAILRGRASREVFDTEMRERSLSILHMEGELRGAIERDEFELYFQPILSIKSRKIEALEALLRWKKDGEYVSPTHFIPIAEESDVIIRMGAWVIDEVALSIQSWRKEGMGDIRVAINLSPRQFRNTDIVRYLEKTIRLGNIDPSLIEVEITEGMAMQNVDMTNRILGMLRNKGFGISLDDFGTGYSSLSYLKMFPITKLKFDRSFIKDLPGNKQSAAINAALIQMGHALDYSIVAEGVELNDQFDFIREHGCDYIQGFLISKPLPGDQVVKFVKNFSLSKSLSSH